jgi:hypothetical protein
MLEKMREAAAPTGLQAKTDLIINADGSDWGGMIGRNYHTKTVRQRRGLYWYPKRAQTLPP